MFENTDYVSTIAKTTIKKGEAWGVHGVGGIIGSICVGIFAASSVNPGVSDGLIYGGNIFFLTQLFGVAVACLYAFSVTYILLVLINKITPVKVLPEEEELGLDLALHGEHAYIIDEERSAGSHTAP